MSVDAFQKLLFLARNVHIYGFSVHSETKHFAFVLDDVKLQGGIPIRQSIQAKHGLQARRPKKNLGFLLKPNCRKPKQSLNLGCA